MSTNFFDKINLTSDKKKYKRARKHRQSHNGGDSSSDQDDSNNSNSNSNHHSNRHSNRNSNRNSSNNSNSNSSNSNSSSNNNGTNYSQIILNDIKENEQFNNDVHFAMSDEIEDEDEVYFNYMFTLMKEMYHIMHALKGLDFEVCILFASNVLQLIITVVFFVALLTLMLDT